MTRGGVAASVRKSKEAHPERFCPVKDCLWRTGDGSRCPKHGGARDLPFSGGPGSKYVWVPDALRGAK